MLDNEQKNIWCDYLHMPCPGYLTRGNLGEVGFCGRCEIPLELEKELSGRPGGLFSKRVNDYELHIRTIVKTYPSRHVSALVRRVKLGVRS